MRETLCDSFSPIIPAKSCPAAQDEPGISGAFRVSPNVGLLFFCLLLCNILLVGHIANAALALVEIAVVLFFLVTKRLDHAILWHFFFIMTSIDANTALLGDESFSVCNYSGLKLVGPVRVSYVISLLLLCFSIHKEFKLKGLLYKFLCFLAVISSVATLFFLYGAFFCEYYVQETAMYFVYIGMTCCNLIILLKNLTPYLLKTLPFYLYNLLIVSPVATFAGWFVFHHVARYDETLPGLIQADIDFLAPVLLFFVFQRKTQGKMFLYISLGCLLLNLGYAGGGGEIMICAICCSLFVITMFFSSRGKDVPVFAKFCIVLCLVFGVFLIYDAVFADDFYLSISKIKMRQFLSLFTSFSAKSLHDVRYIMGSSPFIRFAELIDSVYENSHNLLHLLFGQGYGSFITDELNLMQGFNLENGSYTYEQVMSGHYIRLHGTFPSVMLIHGFSGIIGFCCFILAYLRRITISPFAFCALIWMGLSFYFNYQCTIYGMTALLVCDIAVAHRNGLISDDGVFCEKKQG